VSTIAKFLLALLTLPIGCAHQEPYAPKMETFTCPRPLIKTLQEPWSKEDEKMLSNFNEGCKKHFTKNHCPVRVLKSKNLSYQVTCKKVK
jgi:hypothetical protein